MQRKIAMSSKPSPTHEAPRVLLAEDDQELRAVLVQALRKNGYQVTECGDGFRLLDHLGSVLRSPEVLASDPVRFDLVISDIRMPGVTGMSVLEGVSLFEGFCPVILITAFGDEETHAQAKRLGAAAIFDKPFDINDLLLKVRQIAGVKPH
jgi:CheY-like chemotaxis protein